MGSATATAGVINGAMMRAWLQLLRISNLPTVWSNVLLGVVSGGFATGAWEPSEFGGQLRHAWPLMLAMSCFYLAGMSLNDVVDVAHDRIDAPHRPIVTGKVARRTASLLATALFVSGTLLVVPYRNAPAAAPIAALILCIVLYDTLHHRWPWTRQLMGVCRGLVVVAAAASVPGEWGTGGYLFALCPALLLLAYTNVLTAVAARESQDGGGRRRVVLQLLAAMPLLDAAWMAAIGAWPAAAFSAACAALTRVWHRHVSGT